MSTRKLRWYTRPIVHSCPMHISVLLLRSVVEFQAEQEMIIKNRPAGQKGLTMQEIKRMEYLNMVRLRLPILLSRLRDS